MASPASSSATEIGTKSTGPTVERGGGALTGLMHEAYARPFDGEGDYVRWEGCRAREHELQPDSDEPEQQPYPEDRAIPRRPNTVERSRRGDARAGLSTYLASLDMRGPDETPAMHWARRKGRTKVALRRGV